MSHLAPVLAQQVGFLANTGAEANRRQEDEQQEVGVDALQPPGVAAAAVSEVCWDSTRSVAAAQCAMQLPV